MNEQQLPCPNCPKSITIKVDRFLRGIKFICSGCQTEIEVSNKGEFGKGKMIELKTVPFNNKEKAE